MSTPFNFEEEEEEEQQEVEVLQEDTRTEEEKEIAQFNIPKKYLKAGIGVIVLALVLVIIATCVSKSGGSEIPDIVAEGESTEDGEVSTHYLVTLAQLKGVPIQTFNPQTPLIANSLGELLGQLPPKDWSILSSQNPNQGGLEVIFKNQDSEYTVWINTYSDNKIGRQELLGTLNTLNSSTKSIVSESSDIAGGGFVVNDGQIITYWFYYEPNIVVRVSSEISRGATLNKVKEWAHRVNHSIYAIQD